MVRRKTRMRGRIRLVLGFLFLSALVVLAVLMITRAVSGTIGSASMNFQISDAELVIVRDEQVISGEAYGKISYIADEGAIVSSGEKVAQVYKWGYNENVLQTLLQLQQDIKKYQVETIFEDIVNPGLNALQEQIDEKLDQIAVVVQNSDTANLLTYQRELETLLEQRRVYLQSAAQPDGTLSKMYDSEQEYLASLQDWQSDVNAEAGGRISFYFDQYETLLNKNTLPKLLPRNLDDIRQKKTSNIDLNSDERPLYRLINPSTWYVVLDTKRDNFRMALGEAYSLSFASMTDKTYQGTVIYKTLNEEGTVYVLQIDDDVTPFADVRTSKGTLSATFTGLEVPRNAIVSTELEDGSVVEGIYVEAGDGERFVQVEVLCEDQNNAVFRTADASIVPGTKYIKH